MVAAKLAKVSQLSFLILSLQTSNIECFVFSLWIIWFFFEIIFFFFPRLKYKNKKGVDPNFEPLNGELERVKSLLNSDKDLLAEAYVLTAE